MRSPILFMVFNRPDVTRRVFDAIRKAKPPKLYIAADAPRENKAGEVERCRVVQEIISKVDWPCEVNKLIREKNLGCKKAVSSAIDWFFSQEPEGIILEDDCLPHPDFFTYCDELLERYRNDERVGLISGTALVDMTKDDLLWDNEDFVFCRYFSIWGWASWRRVWADYDVSISTWKDRRDDIAALTRNARLRTIHNANFDAVSGGQLNTWDYQLGYMMWASSRLAITPRFNLIENTGFGEDATHTKRSGGELELRSRMSSKRIKFPLSAPNLMCENYAYTAYLERLSTRSILFKAYSQIYNFVINLYKRK
jgi:hypothetical protein